jgi:hypothetical protein
LDPRNVRELAWRAIRLARIEDKLSFVTDRLLHQLSQFTNRNILPATKIYQIRRSLKLEKVEDPGGRIIGIKKLPPRGTGAPYHNFRHPTELRLVKAANQRGQDMGILRVIVISGTI